MSVSKTSMMPMRRLPANPHLQRGLPWRIVVVTAIATNVALVVGCGRPEHRLSAAELAALRPGDAREAALYGHACKACHARPGTGAPLVHDHAAWEPRWAKGEDVLLQHAVLGFEAMPAGGQCAACTPRDYRAIIRFMADREQEP